MLLPPLDLFNVTVVAAGDTGSVARGFIWQFNQIGYVQCEVCQNYRGSGGGWRPDPFLDRPYPTSNSNIIVPFVPALKSQPVWVEVCTEMGAVPGNWSGQLVVQGLLAETATSSTNTGGSESATNPARSEFTFTVPTTIEVWDVKMPTLGDEGTITTKFNFCAQRRCCVDVSKCLPVCGCPCRCTSRIDPRTGS